MKEGGGQVQGERKDGGGSSGSSGNNVRSVMDKEKTKMRERQRRSITTKIFQGLRKHGGYHLSPRADINEVLRHLAVEAGWVVEPDGTTYRSSASTTTTTASNMCSACGAGRKSGTPTPTSSFIGGGGDCSTTASPHHIAIRDSIKGFSDPTRLFASSAVSTMINCGVSSSSHDHPTSNHPLAICMYGRLPNGLRHPSTTAAADGGPVVMAVPAAYHHQQVYLQEARSSNQSTPAGSPQHRG
ncbi:unnamed protein product [Ilex paraguariensis]|uniref:Protein BZR1 homolog n=1 Tax=Ilex paraguariensis TaxID=185542 RepID=A0ABC8RD22_9AQUA